MGCIYLYTNKINGKQYIGQTIQPIQVRHYNHLHQNNYFDRALKKYGRSNFTLEILEDNIFDSRKNLIKKNNIISRNIIHIMMDII